MIGKVTGVFYGYYNNTAIIDIASGELSVGYDVIMKHGDILSLKYGEIYTLYIKEIIKEDDDVLYGFLSFEEKCWFEEFIKLNSLGPKIALSILSTYDIETIKSAILTNNCDCFSSVSGIGSKLANRIPNEMIKNIDKITEKVMTFNHFDLNNSCKSIYHNQMLDLDIDNDSSLNNTCKKKHTKQLNHGEKNVDVASNNNEQKIIGDAVEALITLGFSKQQVYNDIYAIMKENKRLSTEEIVKLFLKKKAT